MAPLDGLRDRLLVYVPANAWMQAVYNGQDLQRLREDSRYTQLWQRILIHRKDCPNYATRPEVRVVIRASDAQPIQAAFDTLRPRAAEPRPAEARRGEDWCLLAILSAFFSALCSALCK